MIMQLNKVLENWDKGDDPILHNSPNLIVAHGQEDLPCIQEDCHIALTYFELYVFSKGLGTCWAGFLNSAANSYFPVIEAMKLPKGHKCFGAVMIGYPENSYHLIPKRKPACVTFY